MYNLTIVSLFRFHFLLEPFHVLIFPLFDYTKQLSQTLEPGRDKKDDGAKNSVFNNDFWISTCL